MIENALEGRVGPVQPLRYRPFAQDYLLTSDAGRYVFLNAAEFEALVRGKIRLTHPRYSELVNLGFIRERGDSGTALAQRFRLKNHFLGKGTGLHIVVVTARCNQDCLYCHASARRTSSAEMDMNIETAKLVVDAIFMSPNPSITIEFQGGEPLLNWETVKFIVEYAQEKNRLAGKGLILSLVTNLALLDDVKLEYLIEKRVSLCGSLDGPRELHERNRGNNHAKVTSTLAHALKRYTESFDRYKPAALPTITRASLNYPRELVDEYVGLGMAGIHLRPLNPFGFAAEKWKDIGYSPEEFLDFYRRAMGRVLEADREGTPFFERSALIFLIKILTDSDPNYMDIRSPCGAGIGQLAYHFDGSVYTCDEGRMLAMSGDPAFKIGDVRENSYEEIVRHTTVRTLCLASCLDGLPGCSSCVYKPYCGVCPVYNYVAHGNVFAPAPTSARCTIQKGILDFVFEGLKDPAVAGTFRNWIDRGVMQ